jgi:hypothetical protein
MTGFSSRALLFLLLSSAAVYAAPAAMPRDTLGVVRETPTDSDSDDEAPRQPTISVSPLSKPSIDGFGTMDASNGGLSSTVWQGTTRESADALLSLIHTGIANDTIQKLTVRLLMTQANPPTGTGPDWFSERVKALVAIGQDDKAEQMIASLPPSMSNDSLRRVDVELSLLRGDTASACKHATTIPDASDDITFWQKTNILCKALAGKQNEVMVGLDILHEENKQSDMFFQECIRRMSEKNAPIKSLPKQWTLFDVALIRIAGGSDYLKDKIENLPPASLKYIAQDTKLDMKLREKATARAEQLGLLATKESNKTPEPPFERPLGSDVTTLVTALGSDKPANASDNAVIARLAIDSGSSNLDSHRVQRLLTLMQPFGYNVPAEVWKKLYAHKNRFDGEAPSAAMVAQINAAAQAGRKAEVILLAALIMGSVDADKATDLAILPVVNALKATGFEKEARQLAYGTVKSYSGR